MAIGPPGAPAALYMNSSVELESQIKYLTLNEEASRWSNLSQNLVSNYSISDASTLEATSSYWFLTDKSFRHQVGSQLFTSPEAFC